MATSKTLLYSVLIINLIIVIVNITAWQHFWGPTQKAPIVALTVLNTTTNSPNLRGSNNNEFLNKDSPNQNAEGDPASFPPLLNTTVKSSNLRGSTNNESLNKDSPDQNKTGNPASFPSHPAEEISANLPSAHFVHPFDRLSRRLEQLDWDPHRIDEVIRKYWKIDKSFLRYRMDRQTKNIRPILSTSCLHTAAWIVVGLLELQTRPNIFKGLWHVPKDKSVIVYQNTQSPPSMLSAPILQSLRDFVDSRPLNESIVLQIDMYHKQTPPIRFYIDHHFAIHIYNGSVNLYQAWQDEYNLLEWMQDPGMFQLRYPMPLETFLAHFEKFLNYTEEENEARDRLKSVWEIFGTTKTLVHHRTKGAHNDATVRALRFPWVVTMITHWPHAQLESALASA